jgi:hypothetical protein
VLLHLPATGATRPSPSTSAIATGPPLIHDELAVATLATDPARKLPSPRPWLTRTDRLVPPLTATRSASLSPLTSTKDAVKLPMPTPAPDQPTEVIAPPKLPLPLPRLATIFTSESQSLHTAPKIVNALSPTRSARPSPFRSVKVSPANEAWLHALVRSEYTGAAKVPLPADRWALAVVRLVPQIDDARRTSTRSSRPSPLTSPAWNRAPAKLGALPKGPPLSLMLSVRAVAVPRPLPFDSAISALLAV